jgi:hypothetical protein
MSKIIAVHQPNFFPWLGYFDKIAKSDAFVILDDVQFPRSGSGTWVNRVRLCVSGEGRWLTAPIKRDHHGTLNINEKFFDNTTPWRQKMIKTIESNYKKAEFYNENIDFLVSLISNNENNIAYYNISNIRSISEYLGLDNNKIKLASSFQVNSTSTQRIIDLVKLNEGNSYFCGGGATGYQEDELYEKNGITLNYQNYIHPHYAQRNNGEFIKGLSIIDAIMNLGKEATTKLLLKTES